MAGQVLGLWHLALRVTDLGKSRRFYQTFFGMQVVWQPDADNVYLSSGRDNLALHQIRASELEGYRGRHGQWLDHLGFIMDAPESVDRLFAQAQQQGVKVVQAPKRHRDGSYSCYLADPDENTVQVLYEPMISGEQTGKQG
jgi:catechol 2,3-dioxygenase-like lactoylglutathione lyase family enzyme